MNNKHQLLSLLQILAITFLIAGIASFVFGAFILFPHIGVNPFGECKKWEAISAAASYLSGTSGVLFSLVGIFYLIRNFQEQRLDGKKASIQSNFFSLLNGFAEMQKSVEFKKEIGAKAFNQLLMELGVCIDAAKTIPSMTNKTEKEKLNIAFGVFYFGRKGERSEKLQKSRFANTEELLEFNKCIDAINANANVKQFNDGRKSKMDIICDGNQHRLGHYFRRLYMLIDYISSQDVLSFEEKYQFAKIVRSQLSTDEQIILFFNTFFVYGQPWVIPQRDEPLSYIEMYNMIKNVSSDVVNNIQISTHYRLLELEVEPMTENVRNEKLKIMRKKYPEYNNITGKNLSKTSRALH